MVFPYYYAGQILSNVQGVIPTPVARSYAAQRYHEGKFGIPLISPEPSAVLDEVVPADTLYRLDDGILFPQYNIEKQPTVTAESLYFLRISLERMWYSMYWLTNGRKLLVLSDRQNAQIETHLSHIYYEVLDPLYKTIGRPSFSDPTEAERFEQEFQKLCRIIAKFSAAIVSTDNMSMHTLFDSVNKASHDYKITGMAPGPKQDNATRIIIAKTVLSAFISARRIVLNHYFAASNDRNKFEAKVEPYLYELWSITGNHLTEEFNPMEPLMPGSAIIDLVSKNAPCPQKLIQRTLFERASEVIKAGSIYPLIEKKGEVRVIAKRPQDQSNEPFKHLKNRVSKITKALKCARLIADSIIPMLHSIELSDEKHRSSHVGAFVNFYISTVRRLTISSKDEAAFEAECNVMDIWQERFKAAVQAYAKNKESGSNEVQALRKAYLALSYIGRGKVDTNEIAVDIAALASGYKYPAINASSQRELDSLNKLFETSTFFLTRSIRLNQTTANDASYAMGELAKLFHISREMISTGNLTDRRQSGAKLQSFENQYVDTYRAILERVYKNDSVDKDIFKKALGLIANLVTGDGNRPSLISKLNDDIRSIVRESVHITAARTAAVEMAA